MCEHRDNLPPEKTFVGGGGVHAYERRAVAKANRDRKHWGAGRRGQGRKKKKSAVDRRIERIPGVWHNGGLGSDGVGGRGVG